MTPPYALRQLIHLLYLGSVIPLLLLFTGLVAYEYRTFLIREHTYTMQELVQALVLPRTAEAALPMPLRELALLLVDHVTGTDFSVIVLDAQARPIAASSDAAQWQDLAQQSAQTNAPPSRPSRTSTGSGSSITCLSPIRRGNGSAQSSPALPRLLCNPNYTPCIAG